MSFNAVVLADSVGPHGIRLSTLEVTFPRFILAEFNTHRVLSRNSASSRAIPTEKQIERVVQHPFIPEFNKRVTGMGVGEALEGREQRKAKWRWLVARDAAVQAAQSLIHVDKSRANRLLEPFMWHTAIVSATDWENFFALRTHKDAQPEFRTIARMMQEALWLSTPQELEYDQWHLPLVPEAISDPVRAAEVSAGRCARVSYDRHNDGEDEGASRARWLRLATSGHWSPAEHPAQCGAGHVRYGNFQGWRQLRKMYPHEGNFTRMKEEAQDA